MKLVQKIPKVDKILEWPEIIAALANHTRPEVMKAVRVVLDDLRTRALRDELSTDDLAQPQVSAGILDALAEAARPNLRRVVNGSGVVINTNLGRSPLPESVRQQLFEVAFCYSNLEFDLERGERGMRYSHVEPLLCELTGAEAALVVNNNAAAVLLALSSLASGKEAVVSRGELVEIGGSFRIPDVMRQSGAILREVGTTNRTHRRDYVQAINEHTGLFLKVHCSNFAVVGFTAEVTPAEMVAVAGEHGIPVMADVGSGNLLEHPGTILAAEPPVSSYIRDGVDVVTFSGDKLLGGPQAGIIVGKKRFIEPMKKHPLLRALRIDKMTLVTLEETLRLYRDPRRALAAIPTLRMLTATPEELALRGRSLLRKLQRQLPHTVHVSLLQGVSQVGGGALPLAELGTSLLKIEVDGLSPQDLDERLRKGEPPVAGRINRGAYLLDIRSLLDSDFPLLISAFHRITGSPPSP